MTGLKTGRLVAAEIVCAAGFDYCTTDAAMLRTNRSAETQSDGKAKGLIVKSHYAGSDRNGV